MNATEALRRAARRWPEREALRDGDESIGFAALDARVNRLAHWLARRGVRRGDRVATFLPNSTAHVVAQLAILRAGAAWVGINRRLAPPEVAFMLEHADVRVVLGDADGLDPAAQRETALAVEDVSGRDRALERALAGESAMAPPSIPDESDVARLRFTSGTTGRPKAAVLTHAAALASLRNLLAELHELGPADAVVHVAPLTHASEALLAPAFWRGARSLLCREFDPAGLRDLIRRERVSLLFLVPTMIAALLDGAEPGELASLRTLVYGAAPIPDDVLTRALDALGPVLLQIYGLSECPFPITSLRKEEHLEPTRRGTCGLPTPLNEIRVLDGDGQVVAPGEVGAIAVRGPQMMREYWRDPAATAAALVDGWLVTGDLGRVDDAGFLTLVDRSDDVIISGGFNVYPREVEVVLEAHPAVAEAAVVGIPHERWGRGVAAWVVARPGGPAPSERELIDFCRPRLAGYKKPVRVTLVSSLPKSPTGKLLRRALRDSVTR